jgi:flagellar motor protein MotB
LIRSRRLGTQHDEVDTEGSWAVSYGDMVTLLLTFFIVFFSLDPKDQSQKNLKLKVALVETLNQKSTAVTQGANDQMTVGKKKEYGMDPIVLKEWGGMAHDKGTHVVVEFPGVSFFKDGKTDVTPEGVKALSKFINVYMPYAGNYFVSIRAFADKRGVRHGIHRYKDNLELTALRSVSTMRVLQKSGLPLSQIRVGGYGETVVTAKELSEIPKEQRRPASELDLARKVVLVIEPEVLK